MLCSLCVPLYHVIVIGLLIAMTLYSIIKTQSSTERKAKMTWNDKPTLFIGDRVLYAGAWGTEDPQPGIILGRGEKNGKPVFDVQLDNGAEHWGYANQFKHRGSIR
jgi:hypothetical protein